MPFVIGRGFADVQILKKKKQKKPGPDSCTVWNIMITFSIHIDTDKILPKGFPIDFYQMSFPIGRSFAAVHILK